MTHRNLPVEMGSLQRMIKMSPRGGQGAFRGDLAGRGRTGQGPSGPSGPSLPVRLWLGGLVEALHLRQQPTGNCHATHCPSSTCRPSTRPSRWRSWSKVPVVPSHPILVSHGIFLRRTLLVCPVWWFFLPASFPLFNSLSPTHPPSLLSLVSLCLSFSLYLSVSLCLY
jgi:hypothetical protein